MYLNRGLIFSLAIVWLTRIPVTITGLMAHRTKATALPSIGMTSRRCRAITFHENMGAAGFEPTATWSEAKHSVQTELSARTPYYDGPTFKLHGFNRITASTPL